MSEALEKAARAVAEADGLWSLENFDHADSNHIMVSGLRAKYTKQARAAITAFLSEANTNQAVQRVIEAEDDPMIATLDYKRVTEAVFNVLISMVSDKTHEDKA